MKRIIFPLLLATLIILGGCNIYPTPAENSALDGTSSHQSSNAPDDTNELDDTLERLLKTMNVLCQQPRPLGSTHEKESAEYLYEELISYGYSTDILPFDYVLDKDIETIYREFLGKNIKDIRETFFSSTIITDRKDGTSQNIIAKKVSDNPQAQTLIISAHYDSVEQSLGVVDNASGVAAVLELAYQLREISLPYNVWFIFFSGEEAYLLGSRNFLRDLPESEKSNLLGNLNVDCIAHISDLAYSVCAYGFDGSTSNTIAEQLLTDQRISLDYGRKSDHFSFYVADIPSALLIQSIPDEGEILENINSNRDTFEIFDENRLTECVEILLSFAIQFGSR